MASVRAFMEGIDSDVFKVLVDNVKPRKDVVGVEVPDIVAWKFCDVMDLIGVVNDSTPFEIAHKALSYHAKVKESKLLASPSKTFLSFLRHIRDEVVKVGKLQEALASEPKADLVNAGIDRLNVFGVTSIYYSISKDPGEWDRLSEIPYGKMYTKLMMDKVQSEIQERFNEIQADKSKKK